MNPRLAVVAYASVLSALAVVGCHPAAKNDVSGDSAAEPSASSSSSPSAVASASPAPSARIKPQTPPGCRAVSVGGTPQLTSIKGLPLDASAPPAPTTVSESSEIPEDFWLDLDATGKLTSRHPRSTRETTFTGPGRVRPCVSYGEEAWVAAGKFESVVSSGERPGVEEWVVTPVGVIRYGAARVEVVVTAATASSGAKAEIKVTSGNASVWTGDVAGPTRPPMVLASDAPHIADGWTRLDGARMMTLSQKKKGATAEDGASQAIDRCKVEAESAKALATAVAGPDASLSLVAPKHVVARHLARAACDVAMLRVALLPPSKARDDFAATLNTAASNWKAARPAVRRH